MSTRRAQLERKIEAAERELARLADRPEEPSNDVGEKEVIRFDIRMGGIGSRIYSYAAIQTSGTWYTTGPSSPKDYTWDELMDFVERHELIGGIWRVSELEPL